MLIDVTRVERIRVRTLSDIVERGVVEHSVARGLLPGARADADDADDADHLDARPERAERAEREPPTPGPADQPRRIDRGVPRPGVPLLGPPWPLHQGKSP